MRGRSLFFPVLVFALSAALVLSGCGGGGGTPIPVAYIYDSDTATADGFASLLGGAGYSLTKIQKAAVETTDFSAYDLIIISHDSSTSYPWGTSEQIAALTGAGLPMIGLGRGSSYCFGQMGLAIGYPHTMSLTFNSVYIVDGADPVWSGIGATGDTVQLYTTEALTHCDFSGSMTAAVTLVGRHPTQTGYYPLTHETPHYFYWAFPGPVSDMTGAGRATFLNVVAWMLQ